MEVSTDYQLCKECGTAFTQEQSTGDVCFRCKVHSVGFGWRGPTRATKQNFHDQTIREAITESMANERAAGNEKNMDFVGTRWV